MLNCSLTLFAMLPVPSLYAHPGNFKFSVTFVSINNPHLKIQYHDQFAH
uniref:Uncharacterized protein n=1 Tax=Myoviridae sp. ctCo31 TaxID=2825053 RepID=A0A8S5UMI5_9CAUD|nr:MAG TPA: hypothetical protein [Myoviridae sp. ctCo31]